MSMLGGLYQVGGSHVGLLDAAELQSAMAKNFAKHDRVLASWPRYHDPILSTLSHIPPLEERLAQFPLDFH